MRRYNYIIQKKHLSKEDAIKLLNRLADDENFIDELKKQAIVWAIDRVGLTMLETAKGLKLNAKSNISKQYNETKGGRS